MCQESEMFFVSGLQIRGGIGDNSRIFFYSMKIYVVTTHLNRLDETDLMMGHKIFFMDKYGNYC